MKEELYNEFFEAINREKRHLISNLSFKQKLSSFNIDDNRFRKKTNKL